MNSIFENERIRLITYDKTLTKKDLYFFNQNMSLRRSIEILILITMKKTNINFLDGLCSSGILSIRILKNHNEQIKKIYAVDKNPNAIEIFLENLKLNNLENEKKLKIKNQNLLHFLDIKTKFDFINIDPFGSPKIFLEKAMEKLKRGGIISLTATDTATLKAKFPKTLKQRYEIVQRIKTYSKDENAIRNLLAFCENLANKNNLQIEPIFTYSFEHYIKVFFKLKKLKKTQNKNIKYFENQDIEICEDNTSQNTISPFYIGKVIDRKFMKKCQSNLEKINIEKDIKQISKMIQMKLNEPNTIFYKNLHKLFSYHKKSLNIKIDKVVDYLNKKNIKTSRVFEDPLSIKNKLNSDKIIKHIKNLEKLLKK